MSDQEYSVSPIIIIVAFTAASYRNKGKATCMFTQDWSQMDPVVTDRRSVHNKVQFLDLQNSRSSSSFGTASVPNGSVFV